VSTALRRSASRQLAALAIRDRRNADCLCNLASCRSKPHVLDDYTVDRVLKVYSDQAKDVDLYEEQLAR